MNQKALCSCNLRLKNKNPQTSMFSGSFHVKLPTLFICSLLLCHFNIVNGGGETGIYVRIEFAYAVPLTSHREVCTY